jgi:hypothetical protein
MSVGDYAAMGRLGTRTPLDPHVPATLVRAASAEAPKRRGLFRSGHGHDATAASPVPIEVVDYSVTGVGFTLPAGLALHVNEACTIRLDGADSHVRVVGSHAVDGVTVWGAMFLDPRPEALRTIEESALHLDVADAEARWNAERG